MKKFGKSYPKMTSITASSSDVITGRDIAPSAFNREVPGPDDPDKIDDLQYDLHHLVATDSQQVDEYIKTISILARNERLLASARDNAQLLFNRIFQLEKKDTDEGLLAVLPETDIQDPGCVTGFLPRYRPVPVKKQQTRWEKFANEKGIQNRKRDRMVWDEQSQSMKPRWGYGRANDDTKDWAIPVGPNDDPYENPFEKRKMAKKERVLKNQLKQMANLDRNMGMKTSHGLKSNLVGREKVLLNTKNNKKRSRHGLGSQTREAIVDTQRSDASMGKFGRLNDGEKKADRGGRRRQYNPVAPSDHSLERNMTQSVVDKLLGKHTTRVGRVITRENDVGGSKRGGGVDSNFHNGDQRKRKRNSKSSKSTSGGSGKKKKYNRTHKK
jgi:regulator of ribosome biosynthesis